MSPLHSRTSTTIPLSSFIVALPTSITGFRFYDFEIEKRNKAEPNSRSSSPNSRSQNSRVTTLLKKMKKLRDWSLKKSCYPPLSSASEQWSAAVCFLLPPLVRDFNFCCSGSLILGDISPLQLSTNSSEFIARRFLPIEIIPVEALIGRNSWWNVGACLTSALALSSLWKKS
ncbi:unnamed protein product [Cuscuta campestris]|uniref:Uncharacterized protein n=1 Tax=Cuscuta campestris TaxID=132261 RepID=A0A484L4I5_9ASTE|nr:unnamed protein product [Cuscuta campestris]